MNAGGSRHGCCYRRVRNDTPPQYDSPPLPATLRSCAPGALCSPAVLPPALYGPGAGQRRHSPLLLSLPRLCGGGDACGPRSALEPLHFCGCALPRQSTGGGAVSTALAAELAARDTAAVLERRLPCLDSGAGRLCADAALGNGVAGLCLRRPGAGGKRILRRIAGAHQPDERRGLAALASVDVGETGFGRGRGEDGPPCAHQDAFSVVRAPVTVVFPVRCAHPARRTYADYLYQSFRCGRVACWCAAG